MLAPGDTLIVRPGVYNESVTPPSGTANAYITYQGLPGAILDGTGLAAQGFNISSQAYLVIMGFEVRNYLQPRPAGNSVNMYGSSHHIQLSNLLVHDNYNGIIMQDDVNQITINDFLVYNSRYGVGFENTVHDIFISKVTSHSNKETYIGPVSSYGNGDGFSDDQGTYNLFIKDSVAYDNLDAGFDIRAQAFECTNCISHDNTKYGFRLQDGGGPYTLINSLAYGNGRYPLQIQAQGPSTYLYNSTFVSNSQDRGFAIEGSGTSLIIRNSIFAGYSTQIADGSFSALDEDYTLYYSTSGSVEFTLGPHSLKANPMFVNPAANDFHLLSQSPAIDAGTTLAQILTDLDGNPRPQGAAYDMGAYEFAPASGGAPFVSLTPANLSFGPQPLGTSSPPQTITLKNTGTSDLTIASISVTGTNVADFSLSPVGSTPCSFGASTLGAGNSCTFQVTFKPGAAGARGANVTVTSNASSSPDNDPLSGTGVVSAPAVSLAPSPVAFGNQLVGSASSPRMITLTNSGNAALNISNIGVTGANLVDFSLSAAGATPCSFGASSLGAGNSCTFNVMFMPSAAGARAANIRVTSNASSSPNNDPLSGTGVTPASVSLSSSSLAFGSQPVGSTSSPLSVTLTNTGGMQLNISSLALGGANPGDFAKSDTCGASVAAGATCTISATFKPTTGGNRAAMVQIQDNASGTPHSFSLSGTGTTPPVSPSVSVSPGSLVFAEERVGTRSATQTITLSNNGSAALNITSITIEGTNRRDFSQTNTCPLAPATLAGGAHCTINVTFAPRAMGARNALVSIIDNAAGSPQAVSLSGTGYRKWRYRWHAQL